MASFTFQMTTCSTEQSWRKLEEMAAKQRTFGVNLLSFPRLLCEGLLLMPW
jgi:hypothetical protein